MSLLLDASALLDPQRRADLYATDRALGYVPAYDPDLICLRCGLDGHTSDECRRSIPAWPVTAFEMGVRDGR
jgi:hypothetical protein